MTAVVTMTTSIVSVITSTVISDVLSSATKCAVINRTEQNGTERNRTEQNRAQHSSLALTQLIVKKQTHMKNDTFIITHPFPK